MRPRFVWGTFVACLSVVVAAMAWSTALGLRFERANAASRITFWIEEKTRHALWRLDGAAIPLLGQESGRPYFHYDAYYEASAAYPMVVRPAASTGLVASPLLKQTPAGVLLHFQVAPGGAVTSPEVPTGGFRARALKEGLTTPSRLAEGEERLAALRPLVARAGVWRAFAEQRRPRPVRADGSADPPAAHTANSVERHERWGPYDSNQAALDSQSSLLEQEDPFALFRQPLRTSRNIGSVWGVVAPLWVEGQLYLIREVRLDGATYGQAVLVDWPALRRQLLASVVDLMPHAELEPASDTSRDDEGRMTNLPLRLVPRERFPGELAAGLAVRPSVRFSLAGAWLGLVVAAAAVALVLHAVLALSERRRVFVSAVTHELRTPLTTFRLYTDMMAEGMVPTEERRKEYLERLRVEAQRLGHLVENVLAYARLENRRPASVREVVDLRALCAEVMARLADRVREAGLTAVVDPGDGEPVRVRADASVVEQILVNLLDNACKYAAASQPPTLDVSIERGGRTARLRLRDHGPGLSSAARRRLFHPFSKSDVEAAASAPGLGLGLALCRSLARDQGGDLQLDDAVTGGAGFVLTLPV